MNKLDYFNRTQGNILVLLMIAGLVLLSSCVGLSPKPSKVPMPDENFEMSLPAETPEFSPAEMLDADAPVEKFVYRLGPGDVIDINIWNRPEISREGVPIGPDGEVSIARVGILDVRNRSVEEIQKEIFQKLSFYYENPETTVSIREYKNNKAFILGQVSNPGVVSFPGRGTLLEALALAGGLTKQEPNSYLKKCSIIRGREVVIWIDLEDLLDNGNMALNASIRNNDVVFVPRAEEEMAFVMGEVANPGAIQLKRGVSLVKGIMLAGGLTSDANPEMVFILRQNGDKGYVRKIDLKQILERGELIQNYELLPDDIIYVGPKGIRKFNYAMEQLLPTLRVLNLATMINQSYAYTEELRQQVWQ